MIAVTIATTAVWVAGVCTLMTLRRPGIATPVSVVPAPVVTAPAVPVQAIAYEAVLPAPRVSPEDETVMPTLPVPPFIPSPRSPRG